MHTDIEKLKDHAIICGLGRIGMQLAKALTEARHAFVIIERNAAKAEDAKAQGWLVLIGDATHEETLRQAGIEHARVLASVLPDDAANVFITLSARSLNSTVQIIARGEAPTTERKLFHAGADKVVLPTHIGAERITELILYPATDTVIQSAQHMSDARRFLHDLGLDVEVVTAVSKGALTGVSVGEAERRGAGAFFIVQINRVGGQSIQHPGEDVNIEVGDSIVLVVRGTRLSAGAIFAMPAAPVKQGRTYLG
jgi:Trk K+ transport system NAD-binding subunit